MKIVNAALLSYGMSGKVFHAPFIDVHQGLNLVGSWERSSKKIQLDYPSAKSYPSLESILEDESIDLVVVNTPTYTHFDYAKQALEAEKHVVVEKAFTTTVMEAVELDLLAKKNGKKISVFQNRRWDSDFITVRDVVSSGMLGDLVDVSFSYDRYNPKLSPKTHKETKAPGAGLLNDLGPHLIDQALSLFGLPESVFATLAITRALSVVDDYFEILLFYSKFLVRLKAGYFVKEPLPAFVIHGSTGSFIKSRADIQEEELLHGKKPGVPGWGVEPDDEAGILHVVADGKDIRTKVTTLSGDYMHYYDAVYGAIVNNAEMPVSSADGINIMKIIEAARQSHKDRCIIPINKDEN